jgi:hypothetical protein
MRTKKEYIEGLVKSNRNIYYRGNVSCDRFVTLQFCNMLHFPCPLDKPFLRPHS